MVKHISSRGSEHKIRQLSSTPNTHTYTHSASWILFNPHHLEEETYAKAIWTETVRFYPHTHNYTVNPDHMCGCRCQLKTSVKTCVLSHVCVCDDCKRKEFNTVNWQSRLHNPHAIISQQWRQNPPCAPSPSEACAVHLLP